MTLCLLFLDDTFSIEHSTSSATERSWALNGSPDSPPQSALPP